MVLAVIPVPIPTITILTIHIFVIILLVIVTLAIIIDRSSLIHQVALQIHPPKLIHLMMIRLLRSILRVAIPMA